MTADAVANGQHFQSATASEWQTVRQQSGAFVKSGFRILWVLYSTFTAYLGLQK